MKSVSDIILNFILNRRKNYKKGLSGDIGNFFRAGGNELIFDSLLLSSDSLVLDAGSFDGVFIENLLVKFGCKIIGFEPNKDNYALVYEKFKKNSNVKIFEKAIWNSNTIISLSNDGINSGSFDKNQDIIKVTTVDIVDLISEYKYIDLIKLNVEGAEYAILEKIIKSDSLKYFKSFLIQFHDIDTNSSEKRNFIRSQLLSNSFKEIFNYNFVWEYWSK
jgi:hypothetical protein